MCSPGDRIVKDRGADKGESDIFLFQRCVASDDQQQRQGCNDDHVDVDKMIQRKHLKEAIFIDKEIDRDEGVSHSHDDERRDHDKDAFVQPCCKFSFEIKHAPDVVIEKHNQAVVIDLRQLIQEQIQFSVLWNSADMPAEYIVPIVCL